MAVVWPPTDVAKHKTYRKELKNDIEAAKVPALPVLLVVS
jgi:hypothetical protein